MTFIADEEAIIPGMAPEDRVEAPVPGSADASAFAFRNTTADAVPIPGLEESDLGAQRKDQKGVKKQPYSKPIPKNFVASWNETIQVDEGKV